MSARQSPHAKVLEKLSEARWLQYRHESEKENWPVWKRFIHRFAHCPICRPEEDKQLDRWE